MEAEECEGERQEEGQGVMGVVELARTCGTEDGTYDVVEVQCVSSVCSQSLAVRTSESTTWKSETRLVSDVEARTHPMAGTDAVNILRVPTVRRRMAKNLRKLALSGCYTPTHTRNFNSIFTLSKAHFFKRRVHDTWHRDIILSQPL